MPSWTVSLTDGAFQVADADGALYPLTMNNLPIQRFNEGWSPRGLQTGLPPLHILELVHEDGDSAIWLHDEMLDYRGNAVSRLTDAERDQLSQVIDPLMRTVYEECVLAPHAAIPAAAHQFDGMLPQTIAAMTGESIRRALPAPDVVVLDRLAELHAGYGIGADALSADWIERAIAAPDGAAQERFDLPGLTCARHLEASAGRVFYVMRSADPAETSLFLPRLNVVFVRGRVSHEPQTLLVQYYASHTERAVSLPEAIEFAPDLMASELSRPRHGLDEPAVEQDPPDSAAAGHDLQGHATGGETESATARPEPAPRAVPSDAHDPVTASAAPAGTSWPFPATEADTSPNKGGVPASGPAPGAPKQNWWQRLLGLGNP